MDYNNFFRNYSKSLFDLLDEVNTQNINDSVELIKKKIQSNNSI